MSDLRSEVYLISPAFNRRISLFGVRTTYFYCALYSGLRPLALVAGRTLRCEHGNNSKRKPKKIKKFSTTEKQKLVVKILYRMQAEFLLNGLRGLFALMGL